MRIVFGVLSLLIVVAIVGVLAKKQLGSATAPPAPAGTAVEGTPQLQGTPKQQVDQFKKAAESAVQQARPAEDSSTK